MAENAKLSIPFEESCFEQYAEVSHEMLERRKASWELELRDIAPNSRSRQAAERILEHIGFELHMGRHNTAEGYVSRFATICVDMEPARV